MPADSPRPQYDCSKCPGYCCSYPRIEVSDADLKRLARHFSIEVDAAEKRFTRVWRSKEGFERVLRHQKDSVYKTICRFFDTDARRCTIYKARPGVCREYPDRAKCGYYEFLKFERRHQDDPDFVPSA
ncbi:MAG: YkgJ family cysteine cluster protein [Burkholderiaceae bacterium]|nr:YkgJ family cysteine cluster protein [Burkholderiaceae bacterium]